MCHRRGHIDRRTRRAPARRRGRHPHRHFRHRLRRPPPERLIHETAHHPGRHSPSPPLATLASACGGTGTSGSGDGTTLTVYSADGLGTWYEPVFDEVHPGDRDQRQSRRGRLGRGGSRAQSEQSDPKADLWWSCRRSSRRPGSGLLQPSGVDTDGIAADQVGPDSIYVPIVDNALSFIANPGAHPQPATWDDLLKPGSRARCSIPPPVRPGDGTAVLVLLHHLMGKPGALEYLKALQANNVGPSSSTGKLQPKVSNGELLVANGDVQMNLASIKDDGPRRSRSSFLPTPTGSAPRCRCPTSPGATTRPPPAHGAKKLLAFLISEGHPEDGRARGIGHSGAGFPQGRRARRTQHSGPQCSTVSDVWVPDWNAVLADLDADLASYQQATGS